MSESVIIYKLTSPSGKAYIGQTKQNLHIRLREHLYPTSHCFAIKSAIRKYGIQSFKIEILEIVGIEEADEREIDAISKHGTATPNGYNLSMGGSRPKFSDETRRKMSTSRMGHYVSPETKRKISIAHLGMKHTKETREKLSIAHRGKTLSPEHIAKLMASRIGKKHSAESIAKMSAVKMGHSVSKETRDKLSAIAKSRPPVSKETRAKLSAALMGRVVSQETRAKISATEKAYYANLREQNKLKGAA